MKSYPIETIDMEKAKEFQFKLVDTIHKHFRGDEFLQAGDFGVVPGRGKPVYTEKVENVLADFFDTQACKLVRGAGTGAIRNVINARLKPNGRILLHQAPVYPTSNTIIDSMGLLKSFVDFNDLDNIDKEQVKKSGFCLLQHSRQSMEDHYDLEEVIRTLKRINPNLYILVDDNYAAMKVEKIGIQLGGDSSAFSLFKLLGPEGIGCIVGDRKTIGRINQLNYSGGSQVQGYEAMDALRSLVYTPLMLALQKEVGNELVDRLNNGELEGIESALIANAQSRVILVRFKEPIAKRVLENANKLGAAPYPIGAESKYEVCPMFYRVSGTFLIDNPELEDYMIRINPMRGGANTIIRVLQEAIDC